MIGDASRLYAGGLLILLGAWLGSIPQASQAQPPAAGPQAATVDRGAGNLPVFNDGRRAINVEKYGITTRAPAAWRLIDWSHDNKAFVLKLPQDPGSKAGYVSCELGVAPETLEDFRQRIESNPGLDKAAASDKNGSEKPRPVVRKLVENRIEALDAARFGKELSQQLGQRLISSWETDGDDNARALEVWVRVVHDGTLYTFHLSSDEAHYDAYRLDFEDMLKACVFSTPETGLRKMPGGYWMQRDYRFALRLPEHWRPAFGPNDKVLFFATGEAHEVFTDNLIVLATPRAKLNFVALKESLPSDIRRADPQADVSCTIIPQGDTAALETVVRTKRGPLEIVVLERRFSSLERNYEVKFTCEASAFDALQDELRLSLDSFAEVLEDAARGDV